MSKLIYVASSWKNAGQLDQVHSALRREGLLTWDFRQNGFWWEDVRPPYLTHPMMFPAAPESRRAFDFDRDGLDRCDGCFVVQPAGIATALEAGYVAGRGRPLIVWGTPREARMDIMWNFAARLLDGSSVGIGEAARLMREAVGK